MLLILIYILTIFFGRDHFTIAQLGIFFSILGTLWLLLSLKDFSWKKIFQPAILMVIGIVSMVVESDLVLKSFPLTLSVLFLAAFIYAEITKEYFLIKYITKYKQLDEAELLYLKKTHFIWIVVLFINVSLHTYCLFFGSTEVWAFYSTVGWYILLGSGILFQIGFRRFYDKKNSH